MYSEYKNLASLCPETGEKIDRKTSTSSLTYTWSCAYPRNFDEWISGVEVRYLNPRGWQKGSAPPSPYTWRTYCSSYEKVVMRIVKVKSKEEDRLWISIRFPGDECPNVREKLN
jgi:hypothetical protein